MNAKQHLFNHWLVSISLTIGLVVAFTAPAWAPPKGGPKPKVGPKKARHAIKPGHKPPKHRVKPGPKIKAKHTVHKLLRKYPRYWHRFRIKGRPITTYRVIGYPYYIGGTSYTITAHFSSEDTGTSEDAATVTSPTQSRAGDNYAKLQELVEMIHEWRTINESPEVHQRVASANQSQDNKNKVESIKNKNREFDKITRLAMLKISQGKEAQAQIEAARNQLNQLIELVESLPENT
ncbi:MAG: hypothetical protein ACYTF1_01105 [Planctomycetota bacterium]|jgi:hypothetical protein